jgi:inosine-uridine nucleoside N-ribohydrolase
VCTSPAFDLLAVTVVAGNVGQEQAAINLATVLEAAGRGDVPVALGSGEVLGPHPPHDLSTAYHGRDGLGDTGIDRVALRPASQTAVELLRERVGDRPGEITVVAVGPLTNIGATLLRDPAWAARVGNLVFMGGSALRGGNVSGAAEANIAYDPRAAQVVAEASWARPPIMVGLDVTYAATLGEEELAVLRARRTPAARFLAEPMTFYARAGSALTDDGQCPCHDVLATMVAEDESLVRTELLPVAVDTGGSAGWGATVVDTRAGLLERRGHPVPEPGRPRVRVAMEVDTERFRARARRLFGG